MDDPAVCCTNFLNFGEGSAKGLAGFLVWALLALMVSAAEDLEPFASYDVKERLHIAFTKNFGLRVFAWRSWELFKHNCPPSLRKLLAIGGRTK